MSDMGRMIEIVKRGDEWASRALTAEQRVEDLRARIDKAIEHLRESHCCNDVQQILSDNGPDLAESG